MKGLTAVPLAEVGKLAKRGAGFASLNKLGIFGGISKVFIVVEVMVTKQIVDLVKDEVLQRSGLVEGTTWAYIRRRHVGVVIEEEESVPVDESSLELETPSLLLFSLLLSMVE